MPETNRLYNIINNSYETKTESITVIDEAQRQGHIGKLFYVKDYFRSTGQGSSFNFLIKTGDKQPHLDFEFNPEDDFSFEVYKDVVLSTETTANGTSKPIYANNLESTKTPATAIYISPDISSSGNRIHNHILFSAGIQNSPDRNNAGELILARNSIYNYKFVKINAGAHYIDYKIIFYETT